MGRLMHSPLRSGNVILHRGSEAVSKFVTPEYLEPLVGTGHRPHPYTHVSSKIWSAAATPPLWLSLQFEYPWQALALNYLLAPDLPDFFCTHSRRIRRRKDFSNRAAESNWIDCGIKIELFLDRLEVAQRERRLDPFSSNHLTDIFQVLCVAALDLG